MILPHLFFFFSLFLLLLTFICVCLSPFSLVLFLCLSLFGGEICYPYPFLSKFESQFKQISMTFNKSIKLFFLQRPVNLIKTNILNQQHISLWNNMEILPTFISANYNTSILFSPSLSLSLILCIMTVTSMQYLPTTCRCYLMYSQTCFSDQLSTKTNPSTKTTFFVSLENGFSLNMS